MITLRPYQEKAIADVRAAMRAGKRRPVIHLPTGAGKTTIAGALAQMSAARSRRSLFLAHRTELVEQAHARMRGFRLTSDIYSSRAGFGDGQVQCASVQAFVNLIKSGAPRPAFDVVFIDEAHHVAADGYLQIVGGLGDAYLVGLTATPYRLDGSGLGCGFDTVVSGPTPEELVEAGVLVRPVLMLSDAREGFLGIDPVGAYQQALAGMKQIVFCVNRPHSKAVAAKFVEAGIPAEHVDGTTPARERAEILERLRTGVTRVVCNVNILTEGFDLPDLDGITLARSTSSEALYVQMVGRALRAHPGKESAIIVDLGGNVMKFGSPLLAREADLSGLVQKGGGDGADDAARLISCSGCGAIFAAILPDCPSCGLERELRLDLPKHDPHAKLTVLENLARVPIERRRDTWGRILGSVKQTREGRWQASFRYKSLFGLHAHEDRDLMTKTEAGKHRRMIFARRA